MLNTLPLHGGQAGHGILRDGFTTFSPRHAQQILDTHRYDRQRRIDKVHVGVLAEIMCRGNWTRRDKIDFASLDGALILVNGHHRMSAQVASGRSIEWTVVVHPCRSMDEVRALYNRFDANIRKRGALNVLQGVGFAEQHGLDATFAAGLYKAALAISNGFLMGNRPGDVDAAVRARLTDDRLAMAEEWAPYAAAYQGWTADAPGAVRSKCKAAGVMAVGLVTVKHQPQAARSFWEGMAQNDGLRRVDPRRHLYDALLTRTSGRGSLQTWPATVARLWSAHYAGKDISFVRLGTSASVSIAGTPYSVPV